MNNLRAGILTLLASATAAGCGGTDDTSALRSQVAALQSQITQTTPTSIPAPLPTTAPDRVVGITWSCTLVTSGSSSAETGQTCEVVYSDNYKKQTSINYTPTPGEARIFIYQIRATVNVRTALGTAYTAYLDNPARDIHLGDPWPPPQ